MNAAPAIATNDEKMKGKVIYLEFRTWLKSPSTLKPFGGKFPPALADLLAGADEFIAGYLRDFDKRAAEGKDPLAWIQSHDRQARHLVEDASKPKPPREWWRRRTG